MNDSTEEFDDYSRTELLHLTVPTEFGGRRLDQVLAGLLPAHSRNRLQGWVRDGAVAVDGETEREPKRKMFGGEALTVEVQPDRQAVEAEPEAIPLDIVFEDDSLLVINKQAGLVVHPGSGNWTGTLMNAVLHHAPGNAEVPRAGIVHRLDKETSGLMVVTKTLAAQTDLVRQLQARTVKRQYWALASGVMLKDGTVDAPIGRHPTQRIKMAVVPESRGGKPAVTRYRILERFARSTLIECSLETGRTHQIRVHLASLGHGLVGDPVYGKRDPRLPAFERQALHAKRLGLVHPGSGESMLWEVDLPEDMLVLLATVREG